MSELRVRMDPLNPGHFFACCGLLELVELEQPGTLSRFQLDAGRPRVAECLVDVNAECLNAMITRLKSAEFTFPDTELDPSVRPAVISYLNKPLVLDWWLDEFRIDTVNLKCWTGRVTTRSLFTKLSLLLDAESSGADLFERARMSKAKFGVDPRSAWNTLNFGFSPNEHGRDAATFPAVEVLAAIGLQGFRPEAKRRSSVKYSMWLEALPVVVARVAFRAAWNGLATRNCQFSIEKRGQSYKYFAFARERENK